MDEIPVQFTIKPRLIERVIFIIIIIVLAVLLVLKTASTPEAGATTTTIAEATTTISAASTTTAGSATSTIAGPTTTIAQATTTTKSTTTTASLTGEFTAGFKVQILNVTYVTLNASNYDDNQDYVDARRKLTQFKIKFTNDYVTDTDVRINVLFYSTQDLKDTDFTPTSKLTITIPNIKSGDTKTFLEDLPGYIFLTAYEQTLQIDVIPRDGLGSDVLETVYYKFRVR